MILCGEKQTTSLANICKAKNWNTTTGQQIDLDSARALSYNICRWEGDRVKLQEIRKRAGLSQSELANRSGVKLQTIQGYELGRRQLDGAHVDTLISIADALDIPMYELIEDAELAEKIKANIKRGN